MFCCPNESIDTLILGGRNQLPYHLLSGCLAYSPDPFVSGLPNELIGHLVSGWLILTPKEHKEGHDKKEIIVIRKYANTMG